MIGDFVIPPGIVLILAGLALPFLHGRSRDAVILVAPLVALGLVWTLPDGPALTISYLGYELTPVKVDAVSRLFATVFSIMAFAGGLFALRQERVLELAAALTYAGSALGVVFAGDLITVFIFWEAMAVASTLVIWASPMGNASRAAQRYAVIHLLGGVILMAGIAGEIAATGSLEFSLMKADSIPRWMILIGFLINAGAPPLSAWLPDAYPEASWSGMVFLSAFTTKTAVYVLLRGFPGEEILVYVGLYMVFYGIVYAILENDMRRILAYSIINQVGFMVCGIGIGTEMALNGAASHAFAHIIYKALLLMSAGAVLYETGKRKCTDLGGLFRTMPITALCGTIGALSISAFPLTSGFVSKSMISQAAADQHLMIVWLLLAAASAGVFLHAGIKFPWFVFFQKDSGLRPPEPPQNQRIAMYLMSAFCIGLGLFPGPLYAMLPYPVDYVPYTGAHVVFQLQLLLFSGLAFFLLLTMLKRTLTITLDFDWFWRGIGRALATEFDWRTTRAWAEFADRTAQNSGRFVATLYRHHGPQGILGRTWPTGAMAFWTTVLLAAYLIASFL